MPSGSCPKNRAVSEYSPRSPRWLDKKRVDVLVHPAGEVVLSESAARLVVGAPV